MIILNRYRVTNIKRFKAFAFLLVLLVSIMLFLMLSSFTKVYSANIITYKSVYVEHGDTLWKIAADYDNHLRIDEFIHMIEKLNNIQNGKIYPGDTLLIPIY